METYAAAQLDLESKEALFRRYRSAVTRHASAWSPLLEACGVLPGA
jgi:hypothetical protein